MKLNSSTGKDLTKTLLLLQSGVEWVRQNCLIEGSFLPFPSSSASAPLRGEQPSQPRVCLSTLMSEWLSRKTYEGRRTQYRRCLRVDARGECEPQQTRSVLEPAGVGWQFSDNFIKVIYLTSLQVSTVRDSSISTIWPAVGDAEARTGVEEVEAGEPAGGRAVRDPQSRTP